MLILSVDLSAYALVAYNLFPLGALCSLLAAGAPLDHINNLHWNAPIESIVLGDGGARHTETLRALFSAGANLQLADRNGNTPLKLAQGRGYKAMVEILQKAGAK